jgi:hypothetical protein
MDTQTALNMQLRTFDELTDRALCCARKDDLNGMSECLMARRKLLETSRGFTELLKTGGVVVSRELQKTLRKDLKIADFLKTYRKKLENEINRYQLLHVQHVRYAGTPAAGAHFVDRKI